MNAAHLHLILVHLPVVGIPFAATLLGVGLWRKKPDLKSAGVVALFVFSLFAIGAFFSGEEAEEIVEHLAGVIEHDIEEHEEAAEKTVIAVYILSGLSLLALLFRRAAEKFLSVLFVLSLGVSAMLAWTANLGGMIRHPEIKGETLEKGTGENTEKSSGEHLEHHGKQGS